MKKVYNAGAGRKHQKSVGLRADDWVKLGELCVRTDRSKSDVLARLIRAEHKKIFLR